ncbi:MAG: hypothetical protein JETT_3770 [Candidatus Jettenia ecosi]|uniref:Uncharacterized protein n=1 Tax=Candidatus Jettenia ecosi TaxID=2494326 RepID=A0A533QBI7_9BACT|nr:MAG: hypothetical protein JETT_3770 [Candidatus Jettenia ecosi]
MRPSLIIKWVFETEFPCSYKVYMGWPCFLIVFHMIIKKAEKNS